MNEESWPELEVGDLCFFVGNVDDYTMFQRRLIYRVTDRTSAATSSLRFKYYYTLRPAFDLTEKWRHPRAVDVDVTKCGSIYLAKLDLLALLRLRLDLDNFIRDEMMRIERLADEAMT